MKYPGASVEMHTLKPRSATAVCQSGTAEPELEAKTSQNSAEAKAKLNLASFQLRQAVYRDQKQKRGDY